MFDVCIISFAPLITEARTLNIARTLVKNNYKVCIIAIGNQEQANNFSKEKIHFFPINIQKISKASFRYLSFLSKTQKVISQTKARYYLAGDVYSLFIARQLQKKQQGKIIYDCREIYSAIMPQDKLLLKQKFLTHFERHFLQYISAIIVTSDLDKEYLEPHFHINIPYYTIMNLPPFHSYQPNNYFREYYQLEQNDNIILYQGMLHPGRGLEKLIETLPLIPQFHLVILGEGYYKNTLEKLAEKNNVHKQVKFHGTIEYDKLHYYSSSADVGYCFIEPVSISYYYALPNKLFEYCQANLPILASKLPAIEQIIEKYQIGRCLPLTATLSQIANALEELIKNKDMYKQNCLTATQKLNFEQQEATILEIFKID